MMAELFLLDSNAFITPYRLYYPFDFAKGFWSQLEEKLQLENVIVLDVVEAELTKNEDELSKWLKQIDRLNTVSVGNPDIISNFGLVLDYIAQCGYYKDIALRDWAKGDIADPWLIAAAMANEATIITTEKSSGGLSSKSPSRNAKIPDVAAHFGVKCEDLFYFMREMRFNL